MFRGCLLQNGFAALALILGLMTAGCVSTPGKMLHRRGDEIMVAGQLFHTGTRVVLWSDPGGFDAYRVERRFAPWEQADWDHSRTNPASPRTPNRYGLRIAGLSKAELERVRGGGWDLALLRGQVDQFVLHYDAVGTSRGCFKVLQDERGLSTHFLLDLDGTIYQTLDVKERAWHATTSNDRAVGVEIANIGAFAENPENASSPFARWYQTNGSGRTIITIPGGAPAERTANFEGRPVRRGGVTGEVQGQELHQYDFTAEQYRALARLTAALCTVLPKIRCDYPRDAAGQLAAGKLPDEQLKDYEGVLGHYHIQTDKVDPGPALQWDYVIGQARRLMKLPVLPRDVRGQPVGWRPRLIQDN
jgi:N-acetyl-anhydromuramyl-L-alanine amidase AmpD